MNKKAKEILQTLQVCGIRDDQVTASLLSIVDKQGVKEYLDLLDEKAKSSVDCRVMQKIAEVVCPHCGESGRVKRADDSKVDLHCKNCGNYWFNDSNFSA